jgi:hypothetical protein
VLKYLFVLALFAVVAFAVYWRMRPYLRGVRRFLGVLREVNRMRAATRTDLPREAASRQSTAGEKLVHCAACGTWTAASRAVNLGATAYCSHSCLERAADSPHSRRKSAS